MQTDFPSSVLTAVDVISDADLKICWWEECFIKIDNYHLSHYPIVFLHSMQVFSSRVTLHQKQTDSVETSILGAIS